MVNKKPPYKSDHPQQKKFDINLMNLMIHNGIPFNISSSPYLKMMVKDLDPRIKVKTRQTYSKCVRNMEVSVKRKIK